LELQHVETRFAELILKFRIRNLQRGPLVPSIPQVTNTRPDRADALVTGLAAMMRRAGSRRDLDLAARLRF
jgi:hypothetical protein